MATSGEVPHTVVEDMGPGCGRTVKTVYPPGWEREPAENQQERSEKEADERSVGAPHNID